MQKITIQETLIAILIFQPIFVGISGLFNIPHIYVILFALCLAIYCLVENQIIKKSVGLIIFFVLIMTINLSREIIRLNEFIYNSIFTITYLVTLILIHNQPMHRKISKVWTYILFLVLACCIIENKLFGNLTYFEGRATLIGYTNPLWAARDLVVSAAYIYMVQNNRFSLSVAIIFIVIIGFLEARGGALFLIVFVMWNLKPKNILILLLLLIILISATWNFNPYSTSYRLIEWYAIITNIHEIPLFGFGLAQYANITFTNLGIYSHNWVFDYILAQGIVGFLLAVFALRGLFIGMQLKSRNELVPILCLPIVYGLTGLTQGSLISSLIAVSILPFLNLLNIHYKQSISNVVGENGVKLK